MTTDLRLDTINSFTFTPENVTNIANLNKDAKNAEVTKSTDAAIDTFASVFQAAVDVLDETNRYQLAASKAQTDLATGKTDDILAVMLAQDRAYSSLNFTVQVTNKIIESYREIMRMQI